MNGLLIYKPTAPKQYQPFFSACRQIRSVNIKISRCLPVKIVIIIARKTGAGCGKQQLFTKYANERYHNEY